MSKHAKPTTVTLIDEEIMYGILENFRWPAGTGRRRADVKKWWQR